MIQHQESKVTEIFSEQI
jgi:hypothetical protein